MEKMSLAARVRALSRAMRHKPEDGPKCDSDCPRCEAITVSIRLEAMRDLSWQAHCDLAALVADPKCPDWMPALGASNTADADCLDSAYRATGELAAALADPKEGA